MSGEVDKLWKRVKDSFQGINYASIIRTSDMNQTRYVK